MRILLTGGTGFIGAAVARALRERRDDVVIVSRGNNGDITWEGVEAEVERADAVVHLAGEPIAAGRWTAGRLERIRASRVDTTARIARAIANGARKPRVLVSASAIGIYGTRLDDELVDESAKPADDELARICVAWEAAAEPARGAGVRVVHPRIGVVLGREGGALSKMTMPFVGSSEALSAAARSGSVGSTIETSCDRFFSRSSTTPSRGPSTSSHPIR